jgi:hypothetical protein
VPVARRAGRRHTPPIAFRSSCNGNAGRAHNEGGVRLLAPPRRPLPPYAGSVPGPQELPKAEVARILRSVGFSTETIAEILAPLMDPVDYARDGEYLLQHGVTHDKLISAMGGSP